MKNKLIIMVMFSIFIIMSNFITVNALSTTVTATGGEVKSQEEITITLTSSVSLWGYTVSVTDTGGCTFKSVAVPSGVNGTPNGSTIGGASDAGTKTLATYKFTAPNVTADKMSTIKFSISGILSANDEELTDTSCNATITVKAPVVETPPPTTTPEPKPETPPATVTKSSEARLKNFGIRPKEYDFKGFKKDQLEGYSAEVPNSVTSVEVYADPVDDKATVSGVGKVTLNEGNNKVGIKVTAEDGKTTKTYYLTIKRKTVAEEEAENGEARLKSLSITPKEYDFTGFDSEKTEYSVEVPNEVEEIEILATAMDSKAQITGTGIINLEEGVNNLKIEVIAVNGDKKTYTLSVTRKEAEKKEVLGLTALSIDGLELTPNFKVGTYEYTAELEEDLTSLEIKAKSSTEDATVEIIGNKDLQQGENVITILVTNKEKDEVITYQIIVNKNVTVVEEIVQTSWLKPSTWGKEEKIKIAIIIVLIMLIVWAVVLKVKISKESKKAKKVDLPGAEELDKAIAEHQELSEEPKNFEENVTEINNIEETQPNNIEQNYIEEIAMNRFGNMEDEETMQKPKRRGRHF